MNVARCESSMRDIEPADPGQGAAGDDDVVERDVALGVARRPPPRRIRPSMRHPLVDRELAGDDALQDGLEVAGLGLGQEADLAEVDAEDRDVDLGHGPGRAQERAVAAEHDQARRSSGSSRTQRSMSPACAAQSSMPRTAHQPAARVAELDGGLAGWGCRRSRCGDGHGAPSAAAMRSPMSAQPGPGAGGGGTRGCPPAPGSATR